MSIAIASNSKGMVPLYVVLLVASATVTRVGARSLRSSVATLNVTVDSEAQTFSQKPLSLSEVVPDPLKARTTAALEKQRKWLPEALRTGEWPKDLFAPYLQWDQHHAAFVSNKTNVNTFRTRYPDTPKSTTNDDAALRAFLSGMARAKLPAIISSGSLLGFLRQGAPVTDDADFMSFARFLSQDVVNSAWWGICLRPDLPVLEKFGIPNEAGYELSYKNELGLKIDLFFAEEEEEYYSVGFWVKRKLYRCVLPGPTAFAPAMDESGARFFISTTALIDLEYMYGPKWTEPFTGVWNWATTPEEFPSCDMHHPMDTHHLFATGSRKTSNVTQKLWDGAMERLKSDMSQNEPVDIVEPMGGACPPW